MKLMRLSVFFLILFFCPSLRAEIPDSLINALIQVESSGNDRPSPGDKHLKNKAYGCLQIRQPYVDDVNKKYGTSYRAENCQGNRELSIWIFKRYMEMYATESRLGRKPTFEDIARIHNGGPSGCFEGGALNRYGKLPKKESDRLKVARVQENAKSYWQNKVKKVLGS